MEIEHSITVVLGQRNAIKVYEYLKTNMQYIYTVSQRL
jgi:hypothetical protein